MNRNLLILLIVLVSAAYMGTLIAQDPGYVLVAYAGYSMQTSLWVILGMLLVFTLLVYFALKTGGMLSRVPRTYIGWRAHRRARRANDLTTKGHRLIAEGEHERARKFLDSGAVNNDAKAINYLAAARAADRIGDRDGRESYLRMAVECDKSLQRATSVVASELALARGEPEQALILLNDVTLNDHILEIKLKAIRAIPSWLERLAALRHLGKADSVIASAIEKDSVAAGLSDLRLSDDDRHELFRNLSGELKRDAGLIALYVGGLTDKDSIEPLLRSNLKRSWNRELVILYGELGDRTLNIRMKTAKNWLKTNSTDPALHYCLGRIHEQKSEQDMAKNYYASSVEAGGPHDAAIRLGQIMSIEGQYEKSVALYQGVMESIAS